MMSSPNSFVVVEFTIHPASADTSEGSFKGKIGEKYAMDYGWNWIFGDLETFLTFSSFLGQKWMSPRTKIA